MKIYRPKLCECGCKQEVSPGRRFIHGHNRRGKPVSMETANKIAMAVKIAMNRPEAKKKQSENQTALWADKKYRESQTKAIGKPSSRANRSKNQKKTNKRQDVKDKRSKATIENWKNIEVRKNRIQQLQAATNTPEIKLKRKQSTTKTWQDIAIREKRIQKMIEAQNRPEVKLKISNSDKKKWSDSEYKEKTLRAIGIGSHILPNKPETFIMNLLNDLYPNEWKYTGDFSFIIGGKNPDFVNINGQKKCIEHFGDYWHKDDDPQDRINLFKQYGWDCLVIWESELKNFKKLRRKIFDFAHAMLVKGGPINATKKIKISR